MGEVNVLALVKNNKFNYLLFVNYFLLYSTHIHNALHGASAHLPGATCEKSVGLRYHFAPLVPLFIRPRLGGWGLLPVEASRAG